MSTHDLRRKAQRLSDLRRRHEAHEKLSDEEMSELRIGISAEEEIQEYAAIIDAIRGERRNALPSKKARATNEKREIAEIRSKPIDLTKFLEEDQIMTDGDPYSQP